MLTLDMTFTHHSRKQVAIPAMSDWTSNSFPFCQEIPKIHPSFSWNIEKISINSGIFLCGAQHTFFENGDWKGYSFQIIAIQPNWVIIFWSKGKNGVWWFWIFLMHCRDGMIKIWSIFLEVQSIKFHSTHCKHFLMKHLCYFAMHWNCYSH